MGMSACLCIMYTFTNTTKPTLCSKTKWQTDFKAERENVDTIKLNKATENLKQNNAEYKC